MPVIGGLARDNPAMSLSRDESMNGLLPVLYQDNEFIAVDKPTGMFVHRTAIDWSVRDVLLQTLRDQIQQSVFLIHRLDRPTSGIVLVGLSSEAAAAASRLFRERQVSKTYLALVRGYSPDAGRIDRPLTSPEVVQREPLEAVTEFQTEQRFEIPVQSDRFPTTRCSLVRATPRTGRFHQIRRHLNGIDHPVIGDTSHGDTSRSDTSRGGAVRRRQCLDLGIGRSQPRRHRGEFRHRGCRQRSSSAQV